MKTLFKIAGIGELLWDVLPSGKQLGGAPFNFAYHAMEAGCESYVVSAVGKDDLGLEIIDKANNLGMNCQYIQKNRFPTSTVTVNLDKLGHPDFTIHQHVAWDHIEWNDNLKILAKKLDAVCFGSLAQRDQESAQTIRSFLAALKPECLKVFDINLRQNYFTMEIIRQSFGIANILKLNNDELPIISRYFGLQGDIKSQLQQLIRQYGFNLVAYTMGSKGSILMSHKEYSEIKASKVKVIDSVGAGDSFTAILVTGILKTIPLTTSHKLANEVAAYVCTQEGATPELPETFINQFTL